MTTLEQFREEMHAGHVMIVTELAERIEASERYARMLHEDALARIGVIGEGLAALDEKVDMIHTSLSGAIEASRAEISASRAETRGMFEQVFSRLDVLTAARKSRRSKKG